MRPNANLPIVISFTGALCNKAKSCFLTVKEGPDSGRVLPKVVAVKVSLLLMIIIKLRKLNFVKLLHEFSFAYDFRLTVLISHKNHLKLWSTHSADYG